MSTQNGIDKLLNEINEMLKEQNSGLKFTLEFEKLNSDTFTIFNDNNELHYDARIDAFIKLKILKLFIEKFVDTS